MGLFSSIEYVLLLLLALGAIALGAYVFVKCAFSSAQYKTRSGTEAREEDKIFGDMFTQIASAE